MTSRHVSWDLVTVAHGTRHLPGNDVARQLTAAAGRALGIPATVSFVELCEPSLTDVLAAARRPVRLVPLLLSTGHHVRVDLARAAAEAPVPVSIAAPLGPAIEIASAQVDRLLQAGAKPGQPVVLVAAGSRDPAGARDVRVAGKLLARAWGGPVRVAAFAGPLPRPVEVVCPGDAISSYLLADGHFAQRAAEAGLGGPVAGVLGPHPLLASLLNRRAHEIGAQAA